MTVKHLKYLFNPGSVALFGASERPGSVGKTITQNLLNQKFKGDIWLVNPKHKKVSNQTCYKDAKNLPGVPQLAIIATPPKYVPRIIKELGEKGTKAAVVITAGLSEQKLTQKMLDAAKPHNLRIIGPNCMGVMMPNIDLNASFAHTSPARGDLAFLSQSGAVLGAVLDWAKGSDIGFSSMISMGNMADVDLGDMLDYLGEDKNTRAILMYLEHVTHPQKFMSAARFAARVKPVVVIKSGRHTASAKAAYSHTGALAGQDAVYQAAFHRAGILRVLDLEELFVAVETLSRLKYTGGDRLAILTNGGGAGVLAVDRLMDYNGTLAQLSQKTLEQLNQALPDKWSGGNPIDIIGDAPPERYQAATEIVLNDPNTDAVLIMNCPTALASSLDAAKATLKAIENAHKTDKKSKTLLTTWLGHHSAEKARKLFAHAGYPTYETPLAAVRGFTYLAQHAKDLKALMQTPPSSPNFQVDSEKARGIIQKALKANRETLTEAEAKEVLSAYQVDCVETIVAKNPKEVLKACEKLHNAHHEVVVKVLSEDISHKSDVGGVALGLSSPETAQKAAEDMLEKIQAQDQKATIQGFTVQPMVSTKHAIELIIGVSDDNTFGPVILFGQGGTLVEVMRDTAMALPPLNMKLARDLIEKTKIAKLLKGFRDYPPADMDAIAFTLVKVAHMIAELPEIQELDINPLLANDKGVLALDARIKIKPFKGDTSKLNPRFAIRPYPKQWEKKVTLPRGQVVFIRPIQPEDAHYYPLFMDKTDPKDIRLRLFAPMKHLSEDFTARLTQIDYARAMAFIALDPQTDELVGVSRMSSDANYERAEYAVITRSDKRGQGIGWALMQQLIDYAKSEGIQEIWGQVLAENKNMLNMCKDMHFNIETDQEDPSLRIVILPLQ